MVHYLGYFGSGWSQDQLGHSVLIEGVFWLPGAALKGERQQRRQQTPSQALHCLTRLASYSDVSPTLRSYRSAVTVGL